MSTGRTILVLVAIIVIGLILYSLQRPATPAATRAPYTITGASGTITIPSTRHINAFDPATNSNIDAINVWRAAGRGNQPPACQLEHGDTIAIDDSAEAEGTMWVHVTSGGCSGWLLTEFVGR